ncbi:uncharacterized protein DFL_003801 [Arthrobotrys flagrans]|uniref:Uncharacterized protein n=1 Tax=Arthrobotrys flagrans TaxID=97331 RepID=A0A437A327_ARTFL|nr:hypothetical protein DFL_003801 [Arthrobotrys flagrans]
MDTLSRQLPHRGWFAKRNQEISRGNPHSYYPNTYHLTSPTPIYYGPEPAVSELRRTTSHFSQSPETSREKPPKTPALVSFRLDGHEISPFGDSLIYGVSSTRVVDMSSLNLVEPSLSVGYCPFLGSEPSDGSHSSGSMSPIPYLDIFDDGSKPKGSSQYQQSPGPSVRSSRLRNFPTINVTVPSAPRDFFPGHVNCPTINKAPPPDTTPSPYLTLPQPSEYKYQNQTPPMNRAASRQSFKQNQEGPWERFDTLANLAVAVEMARDGDQMMESALDTARRSDFRNKEFSESLDYLSQVDYDRVAQEWRGRSDNGGMTKFLLRGAVYRFG